MLLLIQSGFVISQTKTVLTQFGEKVSVSPYANNGITANNGYIQLGGVLTQPSVLTTTSAFTLALKGLQTGAATDNVVVTDADGVLKSVSRSNFGDNLGNHTATQALEMNSKDINNIATANVNTTLNIADRNASYPKKFMINKNAGSLYFFNEERNTSDLTINETTGKTTLTSAQITKGTDGAVPQTGYIATAADANGNIVWKAPAPAAAGDNLGNHTATQALNMSSKDINNISVANVEYAINIKDRVATNTKKSILYKDNGMFGIYNEARGRDFAIEESTGKTILTAAQISKGTNGVAPVAGSIATSADASGNIVWKSPDTEGVVTSKLVGFAKVSISRATGAKVFFDKNVLNPEGAFSGDYTNGSTYTVKKTALHQIFVNLTAYTGATTWYLRILKNGVAIAAIDATTAAGASAVVFAIDEFATGDKITVDMGGTVKGYQADLTKISIFRFE
jgi:hypothetical protein